MPAAQIGCFISFPNQDSMRANLESHVKSLERQADLKTLASRTDSASLIDLIVVTDSEAVLGIGGGFAAGALHGGRGDTADMAPGARGARRRPGSGRDHHLAEQERAVHARRGHPAEPDPPRRLGWGWSRRTRAQGGS